MKMIKKIIIKLKKNIINYIMEYKTLIKLCQKYNIDYKNHYGKTKSYIKLKRKVDQHQHVMNKKNKVDNYIGLDNEELRNSIKYYYIGF